ncbi:DEKNAAC102698 [Brettanomyces naardenensis]|uniref:DEKNAAC102698 n=1 Tax=Brettanomyces naardenensis TaxID=13370 RepID=A0A448YL47_BRENA|nr:DEKNAAC102698 [Brettanomyces naardenensis]
MFSFFKILFIFIAFCSAQPELPNFYTKAKYITELTPKNFDDVVLNTNHTTVVEFYAPWCQYCMQFKNDFKKASKAASEFVQFAAVDCDKAANKPLCGKYKIEALPTVLIFRAPKFTGHGKPRKHSTEVYGGERKAKPLVDLLKGRVKNYAKRVTGGKLDEFLDVTESPLNRTLLISDKTSLSPVFKSLSIDFLGTVDFGHISLQPEGAREGIAKSISSLKDNFTAPILLSISKEEGINVFEGDMRNKVEMSKFIARYGEPVDGPLSERGRIMKGLNSGKLSSFKQYYKDLAKKAKEAGNAPVSPPLKDEL